MSFLCRPLGVPMQRGVGLVPFQRLSLNQRPTLFRVAARGAADLRALRLRMEVVSTVQKITKAMQLVASAKLQGFQKMLTPVRQFAAGGVKDTWAGTPKSTPKTRAVVAIAGDRGLCGGYNVLIARKARLMLMEQDPASPYALYTIGGKPRSSLYGKFPSQFRLAFTEYGRAKPSFRLAAILSEQLLRDNHDEYNFVYSWFKNVMSCDQKVEVLYNFKTAATIPEIAQYEVESGDYRDVLQNFHEFRFACRLLNFLAEACTAECSQRMNAMSGSTKAAGDLLASLSLLYNRTRQAKITTELIEIVSGAIAMEDN